jgi:hypothetical protein
MKALILAAALAAGPAAAQTAIPCGPAMEDHAMARSMTSGALGDYPMSREATGTSWQPDVSPHEGVHIMSGPWMIMLHGVVNGVEDWQQGPRGDHKAFVSGMLMGMAKRDVGQAGELQVRAMLSPDALMGKRGYPELLQTGETANGITPLMDRQHPHDLFMELSASYARSFSPEDSAFIYVGLPGEPAFGPPAFMHRLSIMDSPEAPLSHHWLDSDHITFGVVTAGYVHGGWKLEASRFRGREPDEHRFDIERPKLDSTAVRISWNPGPEWALQASWAQVRSPEQLHPDEDVRRWSASAIYTVPFGDDGYWSSTAAWGRRSSAHGDLDGYALESALKLNARWTLFGRAEQVATDELSDAPEAPVFTVGKISLGAVRDIPVAEHLSFGVGALYAVDVIPGGLEGAYGGRHPQGVMGFVRVKLR